MPKEFSGRNGHATHCCFRESERRLAKPASGAFKSSKRRTYRPRRAGGTPRITGFCQKFRPISTAARHGAKAAWFIS